MHYMKIHILFDVTLCCWASVLDVLKDCNASVFWVKQSLHCLTSHKTLMFSNTAHTKCYLPSALELFPTVTYHNFCTVQEVQQDQVSQFCYCNGHTWRISWMYSQAGVCAIQTYTALKDQRLYTCTGNNNITKSVFCDAVHRLYQTLLYIKNAIVSWNTYECDFTDTHKKSRLPMPIFTKFASVQQHVMHIYYTEIRENWTIVEERADRNSFMPLSKAWLWLRTFSWKVTIIRNFCRHLMRKIVPY